MYVRMYVCSAANHELGKVQREHEKLSEEVRYVLTVKCAHLLVSMQLAGSGWVHV